MPSFTPRRVAKPEVPVADVPSNVKFALPVINIVNLPPKPIGRVTPQTTTLPLSTTSIAFRQQTPAEIVIDQSTNPTPPEGKLQVALNQANVNIKKQIIPQVVRLLQPFAIDKLDQAIPDLNLQSLKGVDFMNTFSTSNLNALQQLTIDNIPPDFKSEGKLKELCPTKEEIQRLLEKKNQLVRALNNVYITAEILAVSGTAASLYGDAWKIRQIALENNPLPLVIPTITGTPPPPGYIPIPIGPFSLAIASQASVAKIDKKLNRARNQSDKGFQTAKALLSISTTLSLSIQVVLSLLNLIDILALLCAQGEFTQEELSQDMVRFAGQALLQGNTVDNSYKGFQLEIRTESQPVGTLYRRFAIALNRQGVTALKGSPSFASSEQILIDEIKYLIDSNPNLKPY
jgi:hypothetical protein